MLVLALGGLILAWQGRVGELRPTMLLTVGLLSLGAALLRPAGLATLGVGSCLVAPGLELGGVSEATILAVATWEGAVQP